MRDYGAVSPNFWTGHTGKKLRKLPVAQTLAMYLMTSPHSNMIGLYRCPHVFCVEETGLGADAVALGFQQLFELGFCQYDRETEEVFVITMARWQIGAALKPGDNRCKGIARQLERTDSAELRQAFHRVYAEAFHLGESGASGPPTQTPIQGASMPHRSQEQEQDQGHGQKQDKTIARGGEPPGDVDAGVWRDFVLQRGGPLTNTACQELRATASAANMPFGDAIRLAVKRGWKAFEVSWLIEAMKVEQKNSSNRFSVSGNVTTPGPVGRDPALAQIEADAARAVPPPAGFFANVRARLAGGKT